jgi:hypothetical protein
MHRPEARIGMIWAQAATGVIGRDGTMPLHLPEDFEHFRRTTEGHPVIMGRRTWDSLPDRFRPLPGRTNIIVTRDQDWSAAGAIRAGSLHYAVVVALGQPDPGPIWIIGGGTLYRTQLLRRSPTPQSLPALIPMWEGTPSLPSSAPSGPSEPANLPRDGRWRRTVRGTGSKRGRGAPDLRCGVCLADNSAIPIDREIGSIRDAGEFRQDTH